MGIFFALLAALLASMSNFCMRRSIDAGGSSKAYLVVQVSLSFLVMILLNPVRTGDYSWGWPAVILGLIGGVLFGLLMWGLGKALENGPPGLSFAVLNASSIMPAVILAILFGSAFGHDYTLMTGIGSLLVLFGLFWAGATSLRGANFLTWVFFVSIIFLVHTLFLIYLQWWAMILRPELPVTSLVPFHLDAQGIQWFMPAVLFVGALFQIVVYLKSERRAPKGAEVTYGIIGGITNGACTFFLILAPQVALAWENAMLFPIFSVSIILICNGWAQVLYKEKVNWAANGICLAGLVLGTVAWNAF